MFTNKYIFIYASVMVIIVAAVLSAAAMFLQPFKERNVKVEKIRNILTSAGIVSTRENAERLFQEHITAELLIDRHGKVINDDRKAFDIDLKTELQKLNELESGQSNVKPAFPLFVCENKGDTVFIIPMLGKGLWGPIWGYIALKSDYNTVVGAVFDHQGETPGLGAEISTAVFQKQFVGKKIFDNKDKFVSVAVVKGGMAYSKIPRMNGVDAISGGTITSEGLAKMIKLCLANYVSYFKNQRDEVSFKQEREKFVQDSIAAAKERARAAYAAKAKMMAAPEPETVHSAEEKTE